MFIDTMETVYKIPFSLPPAAKLFQDNQSAFDDANVETEAVKELLKSSRI